jgi:metal-responsive CopG/Arc/MetJ family transcriptional regulator
MAVRATERHRAKISVTVDPQLLKAVDAFVAEQEGWDRSKVIDEALRLWCAREQERAMEEQYAAPQSPEEQEERAAWREIQAAAAERIFQRP